ncbi:MAG TPA: gluconeogenesis factor YvcK family protein [Patescibacteria group bacterium]|nr:gluconeogenesis factor YvcK family protein [Patescibacteria group bacterium]
MNKQQRIVCLGGGVGTSNLLRGLKHYPTHLTVVTSMVDDGGSSGRLRKAYGMMPPGDMISCIAALIPDEQEELRKLLIYRFPGEGDADNVIDGHKLGNLIMLAEFLRTHDFYKALEKTKQIFGVTADLFPATDIRTDLSALTNDGRTVHTEATLDLALYSEPHGLKKIFVEPVDAPVNEKMIQNILDADIIISGPGDLYTNQLPVLVIPKIKEALLKSKAKKIFVLNIANKPFETKDFTLKNFIEAFKENIGSFPFDFVVANNNHSLPIPEKYRYQYIQIDEEPRSNQPFTIIEKDIVNEEFPISHNPKKLAKVIMEAY